MARQTCPAVPMGYMAVLGPLISGHLACPGLSHRVPDRGRTWLSLGHLGTCVHLVHSFGQGDTPTRPLETCLRLTILPQFCHSWASGPPSAPEAITRTGEVIAAPTFPRVDLTEALATRYSRDTLAQDVSTLKDAAQYVPRLSAKMGGVWADNLYRRFAFADFDTRGHTPWPADADLSAIQVQIVVLLMKAGLHPTAVYLTRAGARAIWRLDRPVPITAWGWFERWVTNSPLGSLTKSKEWKGLGLKSGAVDVLECKSPFAIFRLPYVRRDGIDLNPPPPYIDNDAVLEAAYDRVVDVYSFDTSSLGDAPDLPDLADALDPGWAACGLLAWSSHTCLPTSKHWEQARAHREATGEWPVGGPPEDLPTASGIRTTVASLAGRAVAALDRTGLSPVEIAEEAYRILGPLSAGCLTHGPNAHPETAGFLWWCLATFVEVIADREARDPSRPLVVALAGEDGYRWRTPAGHYRRIRSVLLPSVLRKYHPALDVATKHELAFDQYGVPLDSVIYSWHRATKVDQEDGGGTLVLRTAQLQAIEPEYDAQCDEWLHAILAGRYGKILEALASLRHLRVPCAAILLGGAGGAGKEMLIRSVAAQFGQPPVAFEKALQKHNDDLIRCPVVFLDEQAKTATAPSDLKSLVGNALHAVEPKGQAVAQVEGYVRLWIATNLPDPVGFARALRGEAEDSTSHEATAQRILYVDVPDAARQWLDDHGNQQTTKHWVTGPDGAPGTLVRHLRHLLATTSEDLPATRFFAAPEDSTWMDRLTEAGGVETEIMGAILDLIALQHTTSGKARLGRLQDGLHLAPEGAYVRAAGLRAEWEALMGPGRKPWRGKTLDAALTNLAGRGERTRGVEAWGRVRAQLVPLAKLQRAADLRGDGPLDMGTAGPAQPAQGGYLDE